MLYFFRKIWDQKIFRFLVVGTFNTLFDTTMLFVIVKVTGVPAVVANSISVSIAISVSYFLNHSIVFRDKEKYSVNKFIRFFLLTGLGIILIQDTIIYLITDKIWPVTKTQLFTFDHHSLHRYTFELLGAKLVAVLFGLVWNYLFYKHVVFKNKDSEDKLVIG